MIPSIPALRFFCFLAMSIVGLAVGCSSSVNTNNDEVLPPNILFIIMDDVGIDQMTTFGYGGLGAHEEPANPPLQPFDRAPQLPNIDTIGEQGALFRNAWSMPACSTSRAVFFTGRYPLRTRVLGALGQYDLANYQVSPYELTMPKLLKGRGYENALFGKFHIGLQENNPFTEAMVSKLGWDYYYGWLDETGDPSSIDTSAGLGQDYEGRYMCGFVPSEGQDASFGADSGACYTGVGPDECSEMVTEGGIPPGRACRDKGGILDPRRSCTTPTPPNIHDGFSNVSAHYVSSQLWINDEEGQAIRVPITDIRARTFRGIVPVDGAIDWIKSRPADTPWSATVSFASVHTPVMQPPQALLSEDAAAVSGLLCAAPEGASTELENQVLVEQRELTTLMVEAIDTELSRLLVSIGAATLDDNQSLVLNPNSNTLIVIVGDNGTLGYSVKLPFDPTRAKGTAYQTGVWVPLIVAGPMVNDPNREVGNMVNIADLYQLFAEVAGIENVHDVVPRPLDSAPMLPYLTTPGVESQREYNFTQVGNNHQAGGTINQPCTFVSSCSQIPVSKSVCHDNGGTWWGVNPDQSGVPTDGYAHCCEVNQYLYDQGEPMFALAPLSAEAIRNDLYKVVRNHYVGDAEPAEADYPTCDSSTVTEFYRINENRHNPKIDRQADNLINPDTGLPDATVEKAIFADLVQQLNLIDDSVQPCPPGPPAGYFASVDGNQDGVVDGQDLENLSGFAEAGGSSWYDIDETGTTNSEDYALVNDYLGIQCLSE
ncbi:MAG: sulfatase-like hydrolase/transferase [Myxococcota bacterium]|nr:sulfatase-like hydrolase/transferase [Myxococcota bacterium]